jgi:hypothetical protein
MTVKRPSIIHLSVSQVTRVQRNEAKGISRGRTFPTAASPKSTSFTLLLGFGVFVLVDSDMAAEPNGWVVIHD